MSDAGSLFGENVGQAGAIVDRRGPQSEDRGILDVRDLRVSVPARRTSLEVITGVSFSVRSGETLGIVGESGCGKSLTALAILGLLPRHAHASGEVDFEGCNLLGLDEGGWRQVRGRRISMIFQDPMSALDPVFTVGRQIGETVRAHFRVSHAEARERALDSLASAHIPSPRHCYEQYPLSLSGGMRQRVMIAMALVCEPRLLIADEPTTALDVTVQAQIMDLLEELKQRTGAAMLFITHNLSLVAEICDRMVTMYAGEVVESGLVADVLRQPLHPYTSGLLRSLPLLSERKALLPSIAGRVPSPSEIPSGCRFAPRCSWSTRDCDRPQSLSASGDRAVKCCRQESLALPGVAL